MSEDTAALVERVREALVATREVSEWADANGYQTAASQFHLEHEAALAALDSLTVALERAERERDEIREVAEGQIALVNAAEARAQKAEADREVQYRAAMAAIEGRARAEAALRLIADRTYPATYIGKRDDGVEMYGGSDDASKFARAVLDEQEQAKPAHPPKDPSYRFDKRGRLRPDSRDREALDRPCQEC